MKVFFLSRDSRQNDDDFNETCGSFDVIQNILKKDLKKMGVYADSLEEATHVGIADSLSLDFSIPKKKCFGIFFADTINALARTQVEKARANQKLKVFAINEQNTKLFEKYGVPCQTLGPGLDFDYWCPTVPKNETFTFFHPGFSNIRSGLESLVGAFGKAFEGERGVQLIIKNTSDSVQLQYNIENQKRQKNLNISYINKRMKFTELRDMYSRAHVTCSVLRMSGHGLCIGESAACGSLPLVGDFDPSNTLVNDKCGVLLKPSNTIGLNTLLGACSNYGLTNTFAGLDFMEAPRLYHYDIEEYAKALRSLYENWETYSQLPIREEIQKIWDTKTSCERLIKGLDEI